ncbi:GNAT family N-acetyltransferase [Aureibacillus halotolerans]|nr:GNAT family N-acetyltransferase [Aureibacillus halotolerans]
MNIKVDDLTGPEIAELLNVHLQGMKLHSPPESIHALDLEALRQPGITFWSAWVDDTLVGCGALKELDRHHGEIKSMRTSDAFLRKGVARGLLSYILKEAERRDYRKVSLETGSMAAFEPARRLYSQFGFEYCGPFSNYKEDPNSVFMTKDLRS